MSDQSLRARNGRNSKLDCREVLRSFTIQLDIRGSQGPLGLAAARGSERSRLSRVRCLNRLMCEVSL